MKCIAAEVCRGWSSIPKVSFPAILRGEDGCFDLDENLCRQEMCKDGCMNISAQGFIPIFIFIVFRGDVM